MISRASTHICLNGWVLGGFVLSCSREGADFGSVSRIDSARRSLSLPRILECSQPPLADQVRLATCGRVGRAISLGMFSRLHSRPLRDSSTLVGTSCFTCARFRFEGFLGWSSTSTHLESFYTRFRLACRWRPNSSLVRVHAVLGAGWWCCHSVVEQGLLLLLRFCTLAHYRVRRCCTFRLHSSRTTRILGLREMWH